MIDLNKIKIRTYSDNDAEQLGLFISTDVKEIYSKYYKGQILEDLLNNNKTENIIKRSEEKGKDTFIAEYEGEIVGMIGLSGKNQLRTFHAKYKKQGIGTKLFNHIKDIVKSNGGTTVIVHSLISSNHIYEKMGFVKIKDDYDYSSLSGIKYEIVIMEYLIK